MPGFEPTEEDIDALQARVEAKVIEDQNRRNEEYLRAAELARKALNRAAGSVTDVCIANGYSSVSLLTCKKCYVLVDPNFMNEHWDNAHPNPLFAGLPPIDEVG